MTDNYNYARRHPSQQDIIGRHRQQWPGLTKHEGPPSETNETPSTKHIMPDSTKENFLEGVLADGKGNFMGVGEIVRPDAAVTINERGGGQSHVPVRFDLLDSKALFAAAQTLYEGAEKYGAGNWRLIEVRDHLNHLLMHVHAYLAGDRTDEHLSHALCRAIFALGVELDSEAGPEIDQ